MPYVQSIQLKNSSTSTRWGELRFDAQGRCALSQEQADQISAANFPGWHVVNEDMPQDVSGVSQEPSKPSEAAEDLPKQETASTGQPEASDDVDSERLTEADLPENQARQQDLLHGMHGHTRNRMRHE